MLILVLNLRADDASALAKVVPVHLGVQSAEELPGRLQKAGIVITRIEGFAVEPIRQSAIAEFTVVKRADPHDDHHAVLFADFKEAPHIPAAIEAENALFLLMDNPEYIGADDIDAARLRLRAHGVLSGGCSAHETI